MPCYPVLHFKSLYMCEDESGRNRRATLLADSQEDHRGKQRIFYHAEKYKGKYKRKQSYKETGRERQTGRKTGRDRPRQIDSSRPQFGNPMERLASRQHLGRIIESLEKTGAPEPLSCVNVALEILSAVCPDCLDSAESIYSRQSFNM